MSNIQENLKEILSAVWGKDVRQAIHDSIFDCYEDGKAGTTDLIARERIDTVESMKADKSALSQEKTERLAEIDVERKRINNLSKMAEGSTTGDAELQDIRIGSDGKVYSNAGDAVRRQIGELKSDLTELENGLGYSETISDNRFDISKSKDGKNISSNGSLIDNSSYCVSDLCYVGDIESFNIWQYGINWSTQETYYNLYDENKNRINQSRLTTVKTGNRTNGAFYVEYAFSLIHKNDTMLIDSTKTPTSYIPYHFLKNYFDNVKTWVKDFAKGSYNYITVATDGSGDYVSLRSACESITDSTEDNPYVILIKEGTYDVFSDFTDVELKTESNKGFYIPNYVDLVGVGDRDKTIIVGQLEPEQGYAYSTLSPINLNQVHCLKNITVKSINCRYAVHDDPPTSNIKIKRYVENCVFIKEVSAGVGTGMTIAYGSGHRSGADIEFVNCDFSSAIGCGYVIHNNTSFDEPSKLKFNGCNFHTDRGSQPSISFRTISVDHTDYVTIQGCSAERVEFKEEGSGVGLGCCFDVRGYANDLGTITVTGTTNKSIIEMNGILKTVIVTN